MKSYLQYAHRPALTLLMCLLVASCSTGEPAPTPTPLGIQGETLRMIVNGDQPTLYDPMRLPVETDPSPSEGNLSVEITNTGEDIARFDVTVNSPQGLQVASGNSEFSQTITRSDLALESGGSVTLRFTYRLGRTFDYGLYQILISAVTVVGDSLLTQLPVVVVPSDLPAEIVNGSAYGSEANSIGLSMYADPDYLGGFDIQSTTRVFDATVWMKVANLSQDITRVVDVSLSSQFGLILASNQMQNPQADDSLSRQSLELRPGEYRLFEIHVQAQDADAGTYQIVGQVYDSESHSSLGLIQQGIHNWPFTMEQWSSIATALPTDITSIITPLPGSIQLVSAVDVSTLRPSMFETGILWVLISNESSDATTQCDLEVRILRYITFSSGGDGVEIVEPNLARATDITLWAHEMRFVQFDYLLEPNPDYGDFTFVINARCENGETAETRQVIHIQPFVTATPTPVPTATLTPVPTPTGGYGCTNALTTRLRTGRQAVFTNRVNGELAANIIREQPRGDGRPFFTLGAGQLVDVLRGPVCADGQNWWYIRGTGIFQVSEGWVSEGDSNEYFLAPQ